MGQFVQLGFYGVLTSERIEKRLFSIPAHQCQESLETLSIQLKKDMPCQELRNGGWLVLKEKKDKIIDSYHVLGYAYSLVTFPSAESLRPS